MLKTVLQKEKLLIMSKLSFCHVVFKSRRLHMHQNVTTCIIGKGLNVQGHKQNSSSCVEKKEIILNPALDVLYVGTG